MTDRAIYFVVANFTLAGTRGCGFLLNGVANVGVTSSLTLLSDNNAAYVDEIFLVATITRISFNSLAIVAMGWFMLQVSWCGLRTGMLPAAFCYFGYFAGASGLLMAAAYIPVYLPIYFFWALFLSVCLWRFTPRPKNPA